MAFQTSWRDAQNPSEFKNLINRRFYNKKNCLGCWKDPLITTHWLHVKSMVSFKIKNAEISRSFKLLEKSINLSLSAGARLNRTFLQIALQQEIAAKMFLHCSGASNQQLKYGCIANIFVLDPLQFDIIFAR